MDEDWRQLFAICSACLSHPLVDQLLLLSCCWIVLEAFQFCFQEQWSTAVKQTSNIYTRFSNLCSLKYGIIWIVFSVNTGEHWNPYFPTTTYLFTLSVKETNGTYSKRMDALMPCVCTHICSPESNEMMFGNFLAHCAELSSVFWTHSDLVKSLY